VPSLTIENYVKAIYQICSRKEGRPATTGEVATALSVSPGTVTSMLKSLADSQLVTYVPYEGVQLTKTGNSVALRVLRRHRLIELFLVKTLGLNWDEVHEEAENMEHAVSELLIDRIDEYLGHPQTDPHGDPIPRRDGTIEATEGQRLAECESGTQFRLVRVMDQSREFLRFLSDSGLRLGIEGEITSNRIEAGMVTISIAGEQTALGYEAAEKLMVVAIGP